MSEDSTELLGAVREIRELLRLLAEPAIAERDDKLRSALRQIVGASVPKKKSIFLMDGTRTQKQIHDVTSVHQGELSALVKKLGAGKLLAGDVKLPKLAISIPSNFFETNAKTE